MTEVEELYSDIERDGTPVVNMKLHGKEIALSMSDGCGDCIVAVDESLCETQADLKTALLHESGHCATGAFYNQYSPYELRSKAEYRADKYVSENVITKDEIEKAHNNHDCTEVWEFAEYFGVTEKYMKRMFYILFQMEFW